MASHETEGETATGSPRLPSRRHFPRASHACQRCREKKARCNQQQPCSNCVKHACDCVYGARRKNATTGVNRVSSRDEPSNVRHHYRHPAPVEAGHDQQARLPESASNASADVDLTPSQSHGSAHSGTTEPASTENSAILIDRLRLHRTNNGSA